MDLYLSVYVSVFYIGYFLLDAHAFPGDRHSLDRSFLPVKMSRDVTLSELLVEWRWK